MMRNLILGAVLVASVAAAQDPFDVVRLRARDAIVRGRSQFPTNGLVAYWSIDSVSTTTLFAAYGTDNLILTGSPTINTENGIRMNGYGNTSNAAKYMQRSDPSAVDIQPTDGMSMAAWVKFQNPNQALASENRDYIFTKSDGADVATLQYSLYGQPFAGLGASINFTARNSANTVYLELGTSSSSNYINNTNWNHIALTMDAAVNGGIVRFYINGGIVHTTTNTTPTRTTSTKFFIGAEGSSNPRYFDGSLDEMAIWNRALTSNEVYQLYSTPQYYP